MRSIPEITNVFFLSQIKNKKLGLGIAAVAAAGAGLVYAAQKTSQQKVKKIAKAAPPVDYRNTERGKYEKNSNLWSIYKKLFLFAL